MQSHDHANTAKPTGEEEVDGGDVGEYEDDNDEAVVASPVDEDMVPTQR